MKNKIFLCVIILISVVVFFVWFISKNTLTTEEMIEKIFGIKEVEYTVVEVKNELENNKYDGSYTVVVKVDAENVSEFISKVEDNYRISEYGYFGREAEENEIIYTRHSEVRRTLRGLSVFKSKPKTCSLYIICKQQANGDYEVKMEYVE